MNSEPASGVAVNVKVGVPAPCTTFVANDTTATPPAGVIVPPSADTVTAFTRFVCASNDQPAGNVNVAGSAPRKRTASTAALTASSPCVSTRS